MVNLSYSNVKESHLSKLLFDIEAEWLRQDIKFPNQEHNIFKWLSIITKEIGEINKEALELKSNCYNRSKIQAELLQAITLLIRLKLSMISVDYIDDTIII